MTGTRTLSLQIDAGDHPNWPRVQVFVDGTELVYGSAQHDFIGFDPADILGPRSPLLPAEPARRVAVYRCSCGIAGCGCIAPLIEARSDTVVWWDFRDFVGVYDRPTVRENPSDGQPLRFTALVFDERQYRDEVERASALPWETPQRKTARLLRLHLQRQGDRLRGLGYERPAAAKTGDDDFTYTVFLWDLEHCQVVVELQAAPGDPADQAETMAEYILTTPASEWNVTFRGGPRGAVRR
jgi:hypothetical protein